MGRSYKWKCSSKPLDLDLKVEGVTWAGNIDMNLISEQRVMETRK